MDSKQKYILIFFAVFLIIAASLSFSNLFYILTTVIEGQLHPLLNVVYHRLYNFYEYIRVTFNPPLWEQKRYTSEPSPQENLETTKLPIFDLYIARDDIHQMNARIPKNPAFVHNSPIYYAKLWVPAKLKYEGRTYDIEAKHRGTGWWHWRVPKKSIRIKLPKGEAILGVRRINFINPKFVIPYTQVIEYRLAEYLNLLASRAYMAHLRLNDEYYGIMFVFDQPDKFFLQLNNKPQGDVYGEKTPNPALFTDIKYWEKYSFYDEENRDDFRNLEKFLSVLKIEDREEFKEKIVDILDMDAFYRWYAHSVIFASAHQNNHNIRIYYDPVKRKFEFIPWDVMTEDRGDFPIDYIYNEVNKRILSYPEFGSEKNKVLWDIVKDDRVLIQILRQIDELDFISREDTFCDRHRAGLNFKDSDYRHYQYRYPLSDYERELHFYKKFFMERFAFIRKELDDCRLKAYMEKVHSDYNLHIISYGKVGYGLEAIELTLSTGAKIAMPLDIAVFSKRFIEPGINPVTNQQPITFLPNEVVCKVEMPQDDLRPEEIKEINLVGQNIITGKPMMERIEIYAGPSNGDRSMGTGLFPTLYLPRERPVPAEPDERPTPPVMRFEKGTHYIKEHIIVEKDKLLIVERGSKILLEPNISIVVYGGIKLIGTQDEPIVITGRAQESWGSFIIDGSPFQDNVIDYCTFSMGGEEHIDGAKYTGMLSIHNSDVVITNSTFEKAHSEDAINAKYSNTIIKNCIFRDNASDAIDYDFCSGLIENNTFLSNKDDAIDLSFSTTKIYLNKISQSGDKGVSVGEKSNVTLDNLDIADCDIGIAVKDLSFAEILNCRITNNKTGIALYRKKPSFGGGKAVVKRTKVWYNDRNMTRDEASQISIEDSEIGQDEASQKGN